MDINIKLDCSNVDWEAVSNILKDVGMGYYEPDLHEKAFNNSYVSVFVYRDNRMIGFGRAISDGAYQAAIYDCAVVPEFQGKGIGRTIYRIDDDLFFTFTYNTTLFRFDLSKYT